MGILAICLAVIPSKEELLSEGIKKAVSNDLVDISIPPAKITGEEGKRKIFWGRVWFFCRIRADFI